MDNPIHDIPDRFPPKPEEDDSKKSYWKDLDLLKYTGYILAGIVVLVIITGGAIFVLNFLTAILSALGDQVNDFHRYVSGLIRNAGYIKSGTAAGDIVQLVAITGIIILIIKWIKRKE